MYIHYREALYIRHRAACQRCWCDQWALSWQLGSLIGLAAWPRPPGLQLSYLFIGTPPPSPGTLWNSFQTRFFIKITTSHKMASGMPFGGQSAPK